MYNVTRRYINTTEIPQSTKDEIKDKGDLAENVDVNKEQNESKEVPLEQEQDKSDAVREEGIEKIKTVEEIREEAELARKQLETEAEMQEMLKKVLIRGLRTLVVSVIAGFLLMYAINSKNRENIKEKQKVQNLTKNIENKLDTQKERGLEKSRQLEKDMEEAGYPVQQLELKKH
ncbi:nadE [Acrasis kona]|uniref:NadE n=1 Tax=Acrasis kona TaxID=1008807 RepID=A0AAW2ZFC0_9EUKA